MLCCYYEIIITEYQAKYIANDKLYPYLVTDDKNFWQIWKKIYTVFCCEEGVLPYMDMLEMNKFGAPKIGCYLYTGVTYIYSSDYGKLKFTQLKEFFLVFFLGGLSHCVNCL